MDHQEPVEITQDESFVVDLTRFRECVTHDVLITVMPSVPLEKARENHIVALFLDLVGLAREDDRLRDLMDRYAITIQAGDETIYESRAAREQRERRERT